MKINGKININIQDKNKNYKHSLKVILKKKFNGGCKFLNPKLAQSRWEKIPNQQASISGVEQQEDTTNNEREAKQHIWKTSKEGT